MLNNKTILAIIPARGGSKGVFRKNLRLLNGKSLLSIAVETAKQSNMIDRVIVSSDDQEIIEAAQQAGAEVPFVRPKELARDETPGNQPVLHALKQLPHYDYIVVLQATSPLRHVDDVDTCLKFLIEKDGPACVSVTESEISPYWTFKMNHNNELAQLISEEIPLRRQDLPMTYYLNGAIYAAKTKWFIENQGFISPQTLAYVMPRERSIDIDTEFDLELAEIYMNRNLCRSA